jgi:hypothetical protein
MRVVHVRVSQADFGKICGAMREWLDRKNCRVGRFETEADEDGGIIVVKAQFADALAAELFRLEFQGNYGGLA